MTISVTGEKAGRWFKLQMYCIKSDEAIAAAEEALLMLGAAWSAIAANASKEPSP
ncbi:MAG: hypothetical protein I8H71_01485 [Xanthomonadaceae bacterium]|nr:hypothetical protein [Xanthomonadaceae bacterium]